ncbi:MAG: response regulator transcription factor [Chloroflexi bacterium]|nr:response regulator transcription factor [Chloroflexota bacterium]
MAGLQQRDVGFLARLILAVLTPALGLAGAGILLTDGLIGWIMVLGTICTFGISMGLQERRRVQTAVLCTVPGSGAPRFRLLTFPSHGEIRLSVSGRIGWSNRAPEAEKDSWRPLKVTGSLGLQVRGTVERPSEGDGTDLTVSMSRRLTTGRRRRHVAPAAQGDQRIVVISEEPAYLSLVQTALEGEGWETARCDSYRDAYQVIRGAKPALVILDVQPGTAEDGWGVLDLVALDAATCALPMIVCVPGSPLPGPAETWLQGHGVSLLPKPFDSRELFHRVEMALLESL